MNSLLFTRRCLRFFTPVGGLLLFIQCSNFSKEPGPSSSAGGSFPSGGGSSVNAGGVDGSSGGSPANAGGADGSSGGSGGPPCLTIWEGCPPMDTALEPLHERQNGAGALLLAHDAFWLQGAVAFMTSEGTAGEIFLGALRIPYEPGSTPRVLEGNVAIGEFAPYDGRVYHPDFGDNGLLAVYEPNGDLHHVLDVAQGDATAIPLQSPTFVDRTVILTTPNCRSLFFINIDDWSMERLDIEGRYLGGVTSLTLAEDHLYCMGDGYIYKVNLASHALVSEWRNPEVDAGVHGTHYSWLWNTPQGLLTWRRADNAGDESRFQLLHRETLAFAEYATPGVLLGGPRYRENENTIYFNNSLGIDLGIALHAFNVETKAVRQIVPAERPWGGRWDPTTELQMDDDYYYWVEDWVSESGQQSEFIVRYPRGK